MNYDTVQFKPYQSMFVPTGRTERAAIEKDRYDAAYAEKTALDRALGMMRVGKGDEKYRNMLKSEVDGLINGRVDYENMGHIVTDATTRILTNEPMMKALDSFKMREAEREHEAKLRMEGKLIDFGRAYKTDKDGKLLRDADGNPIRKHVFDDGEWDTGAQGVYVPHAEERRLWEQTAQQLMQSIAEDPILLSKMTALGVSPDELNSIMFKYGEGVSKDKVQKVANALVEEFSKTNDGNQMFRELTKLGINEKTGELYTPTEAMKKMEEFLIGVGTKQIGSKYSYTSMGKAAPVEVDQTIEKTSPETAPLRTPESAAPSGESYTELMDWVSEVSNKTGGLGAALQHFNASGTHIPLSVNGLDKGPNSHFFTGKKITAALNKGAGLRSVLSEDFLTGKDGKANKTALLDWVFGRDKAGKPVAENDMLRWKKPEESDKTYFERMMQATFTEPQESLVSTQPDNHRMIARRMAKDMASSEVYALGSKDPVTLEQFFDKESDGLRKFNAYNEYKEALNNEGKDDKDVTKSAMSIEPVRIGDHAGAMKVTLRSTESGKNRDITFYTYNTEEVKNSMSSTREVFKALKDKRMEPVDLVHPIKMAVLQKTYPKAFVLDNGKKVSGIKTQLKLEGAEFIPESIIYSDGVPVQKITGWELVNDIAEMEFDIASGLPSLRNATTDQNILRGTGH